MQVNRRLYRCQDDRMIAGVAAGIAERFDIDLTIVRLLWVLSIFFGGLGLFAYVVMAIVVPLEPEAGRAPEAGDPSGEPAAPSPASWHTASAGHHHAAHGNGRAVTFIGIALILFGALALIDAFLPGWADHGRYLWPAFIVGIGAILLASAVRRDPTES
jgi:phage shock protein C